MRFRSKALSKGMSNAHIMCSFCHRIPPIISASENFSMSSFRKRNSNKNEHTEISDTRVYPKVSGLSHNEINYNNNKKTINTRWEATQKVKAAKLTTLAHKIAIQLHLVAESCTICSSRCRRPVRKLLDTPSYITLYYKELLKLSDFTLV
jgi:hypothetical protein